MSDREDNAGGEGAGGQDGGSEQLTIRIKDQNGEETFFKIKKTTKMSKVFQTYASKKGVQADSIRFFLDGERIALDATPKMLELEDQDQIDCVLAQTGGGVGGCFCAA